MAGNDIESEASRQRSVLFMAVVRHGCPPAAVEIFSVRSLNISTAAGSSPWPTVGMTNLQRRNLLRGGAGLLLANALAGCAVRGGEEAAAGGLAGLSAARFNEVRRYVATPFGKVACVEQGEGRAVLLLHGFPLNGFQWRGAIALLAPHARCIAPDFLGMGHSRAAAGQDLGPRAQVSMLIALLDALRIDEVDVIANDSGGAVAQLLTTRHAARVRSLLLTNGDTEMESPPAAMLPVIELAQQGSFVDQWLVPWLADPALARSERGIGGMCYTNRAHPTDE